MATLKKYNLSGEQVGEVQVADTLLDAEYSSQSVKDYIVALRENRRQWSACTKGRSEISHSNKKPRPQKGTGNARQGSLSAPQYKGGGVVFGPKPKFDQHVRINKKERRAAIRCLLAEKIQANQLFIIENTDLEAPKTKVVADFCKSLGIQGRTLFMGESELGEMKKGDAAVQCTVASTKHKAFSKSLRNIPRASFALATNVSGYDVMCAKQLVLTEAALQQIQDWLI